MAEPDSGSGRITLTKAQLASAHGKKFVQLIMEIGLDGEISDSELGRLFEWLRSAPSEVPAIRHLRELVTDALHDGFINDAERKIIHMQIERVLPPTERERIKIARKSFEEKARKKKEQRERDERDQWYKKHQDQRAKREQKRQDLNKPTDAQIRYVKGLGGDLPPNATKQEASEVIDRLVNSNGSISPRQQMVLRFWNVTPKSDWGRAQVSVWLDDWYQTDVDHQLAWELFKEENHRVAISNNPDLIPVGAGFIYLKKTKILDRASVKPSPLKSSKSLAWVLGFAGLALLAVGLFLSDNALAHSSAAPASTAATSTAPVETPKPVTPEKSAVKPLSNDSITILAEASFTEKPLQIPATVIDVGILKYVPYLSYRVSNDRELNVYGDPESPACIEIGLYRRLLTSNDEKHRCVKFLAALFPELDFGSLKPNGGIITSRGWTIEVTMPDAPDAYGGWWISVYNPDRLHQSQSTVANVHAVSEPASSSTEWTSQQLTYARPALTTAIPKKSPSPAPVTSNESSLPTNYSSYSSGYSSGRVYVKSYQRKDGTYVKAHSRRK